MDEDAVVAKLDQVWRARAPDDPLAPLAMARWSEQAGGPTPR